MGRLAFIRFATMKIISYNVNGIRAAINKGLLDWVAEEKPDVLCLQEVKANEEQARVRVDEPCKKADTLHTHTNIAASISVQCMPNNEVMIVRTSRHAGSLTRGSRMSAADPPEGEQSPQDGKVT